MAYVYGLRAADGDAYFYIGSTKHPLTHRLKQHLDMIRLGYNKNRHLVHKVTQVGAENVVIEPLVECDEHERFTREYEIISEFLQAGVRLTNVVVDQRDYEVMRATQEYDEFVLEPRHINAFVDALDLGLRRNGDALHDKLAEVIEEGVLHMARKHTADFLSTIDEIMTDNYEPADANRQTAELHRRVLEVLERHAGGD